MLVSRVKGRVVGTHLTVRVGLFFFLLEVLIPGSGQLTTYNFCRVPLHRRALLHGPVQATGTCRLTKEAAARGATHLP